ncbi:MAG: TonB family protein [Terriglobales bacterium]|jgi:protein TonB
MAFRALLFSKSPETGAAMTAACNRVQIHVEVCSDIFTAIEKGKTQAFSCVMADWAEQPEASFLLKRARESAPNRNTLAIAIVDRDLRPAELRDHRLDFLVYRPISADKAHAVLEKACERMKPLTAEDAAALPAEGDNASSQPSSPDSPGLAAPEQDATEQDAPAEFVPDQDEHEAPYQNEEGPRKRRHAIRFRAACAALLLLTAVVCLWRSRAVVEYLARTPEGRFRVLRESVTALMNGNQPEALPATSAASYAQQDAYYNRGPASPNAQTPPLEVIATESTLPEARLSLPKAPDFPLPVPVFERPEPAPSRMERAPIPDSMKNSAPMSRPLVVTVNSAQMMPVSAPQPQAPMQSFSEPVAVSEEAARALLVHTVNPVYPPEALAQKLHGTVVLQAVVGRDGSIEDLKFVRGYFVLGKAAIAAVKQWRFQPYSVSGHAAATQTTITINFSYPPA